MTSPFINDFPEQLRLKYEAPAISEDKFNQTIQEIPIEFKKELKENKHEVVKEVYNR